MNCLTVCVYVCTIIGNLFIHNVDTFDHGNYICRADNGSPPHQAAVVVVDVLGTMRIFLAVTRVYLSP